MWKQNGDELVHEVMRRVISCSFAIKEAIQHFESDFLDLSKGRNIIIETIELLCVVIHNILFITI